MWYAIVVAALVSYLLGNLNGAVCVSALMHDDVRSHGSGNAGLTNFIRNYGRARALYVVAIDAGKAFLACLAAGLILDPYGLGLEGRVLGGVCVMLGHDFPALLGFRGGKGILSGWFIAWAIDWRIGLLIAVVFLSALTGQRVDKLFQVIQDVHAQNTSRITTGALNSVLADATARVQPPSDKGRRLKIYYMTQAGTKPPHFVIFCNDARLFHFSYQRYLENQIRDVFGLKGTPVRITIRQKGDKEE